MPGHFARTTVSGVRANQLETIWDPAYQRGVGKYPVILVHGAGAPAEFIDPSLVGSNQIAALLANAGIPCISAEMSGNSWANDASMTDMSNAFALIKSRLGLTSTKVHVLGVSMGGAVGIRWGIQNPTVLASFTGIYPLYDLPAFYNASTGSLKSEIAAAWGVSTSSSLPSGANLPAQVSAITGKPGLIYYSSADAIVPPGNSTNLAAAMGSSATAYNVGSNGHSEATVVDAINRGTGNLAEVIAFLLANGA